MSGPLHLDTHAVVWAYAGEHDRFPDLVRDRLESDDLVYSPMVRLELTYLYEIDRLTDPPGLIFDELAASMGLRVDTTAFGDVVDAAESITFTRDPFDRLILAQAVAARAPLVTKDAPMRVAFPGRTLWD
ncbi:MAG: PIN domain-containing protein [Actinobacteria bacterium]|nr:PIN domain-containing protein [Actinomycetota bacterium]